MAADDRTKLERRLTELREALAAERLLPSRPSAIARAIEREIDAVTAAIARLDAGGNAG